MWLVDTGRIFLLSRRDRLTGLCLIAGTICSQFSLNPTRNVWNHSESERGEERITEGKNVGVPPSPKQPGNFFFPLSYLVPSCRVSELWRWYRQRWSQINLFFHLSSHISGFLCLFLSLNLCFLCIFSCLSRLTCLLSDITFGDGCFCQTNHIHQSKSVWNCHQNLVNNESKTF